MKIQWKPLLVSLAVALGIGGLAALVNRDSMGIYQTLVKPPLSPPGWVFPLVWTVLFFLMGVSAYRVYLSDAPDRTEALLVYAIQLLLNFAWSIVFFGLEQYLSAFVVLVLLWLAIILMIVYFAKADPLAAKLQIPYLLWVSFAGYLNLAIYFLNR